MGRVRPRHLLIISAILLIFLGLSYAMAMEVGSRDYSIDNDSWVQFIPEECRVLRASKGVEARIEFKRDRLGDIIDRNYIHLIANNVYEGSSASYSLTAQNMSAIPIEVDQYTLSVDGNDSLAKAMYFSGSIRIYRDDGQVYTELGTFDKVRLSELAGYLTNLMEYRKIDLTDKIVLELKQQIDKTANLHAGDEGLSYQLVPTFVQYTPRYTENLVGAEG